jgi:hypothetical protein
MTGVTGMMAAGIVNRLFSARASVSQTYSTNTTQTTLNVSTLAGYRAGSTDITITVNNGVYLYSTSTATPALTISGATAGDTITLVNNGFTIGMGGAGGNANPQTAGSSPGFNGGPALSLGYGISLTNNSYIAGGGGGGGGSLGGGGGGGAGGGQGGTNSSVEYPAQPGGAGGAPGLAGADGISTSSGNFQRACSGGGGGRILPGVGGAELAGDDNIVYSNNGTPAQGIGDGGRGGGAGGGGGPFGYRDPSSGDLTPVKGFAGGSANTAAVNPTLEPNGNFWGQTAGGGGWGAAGGTVNQGQNSFTSGPIKGLGGSGGKAINLNGYTVTYLTTGTVWGAVS